MANVLDVLKQAILAPDRSRFDALKKYASQIRQALDADHDIAFTEKEMAGIRQNPEGLAMLYALLGQADRPAAIADARADETEIGKAWRVFAERLEVEIGDWDALLPDAITRHAALLRHLAEDQSYKVGGEPAKRLLICGWTPSMLFEAFDNIRMLFNRAGRRTAELNEVRRSSGDVTLQLWNGTSVLVTEQRILAQIAGTRDLPPTYPMAEFMNWMMRLLQLHPFLIDCYGYDAAGRIFYQLQNYPPAQLLSSDKLAERWCREPAELQLMLAGQVLAH